MSHHHHHYHYHHLLQSCAPRKGRQSHVNGAKGEVHKEFVYFDVREEDARFFCVRMLCDAVQSVRWSGFCQMHTQGPAGCNSPGAAILLFYIELGDDDAMGKA